MKSFLTVGACVFALALGGLGSVQFFKTKERPPSIESDPYTSSVRVVGENASISYSNVSKPKSYDFQNTVVMFKIQTLSFWTKEGVKVNLIAPEDYVEIE